MTWPPEPTPYESPEHYVERCAAEIKRTRRREEEEAAIRATVGGLCCMCDEYDEHPVFTCDHQRRKFKRFMLYGQDWELCRECLHKVVLAFGLDTLMDFKDLHGLIFDGWERR